MVYVTVKQQPKFRQVTIDKLLEASYEDIIKETADAPDIHDDTATRTYKFDYLKEKYLRGFSPDYYISLLEKFIENANTLYEKDKRELYNTFYLEKKGKGMRRVFKYMFDTQKSYIKCDSSEVCRELACAITPLLRNHPTARHGEIHKDVKTKAFGMLEKNGFDISRIDFDKLILSGYRRIDAPVFELECKLRELKEIFESNEKFGVCYHTSAYAYIKGRSTLKAIQKHQQNKSRWFAKFDLSNFFGNTTPDFVMNMFSMVFPFSEIIKKENGRRVLEKAISLAFLDGGLPQGTPISPLITNVMMIPIDFALANRLRELDERYFVYTRYADDFLVSSRKDFNVNKVQDFIKSILAEFNAPFSINEEKTRYGSSSGSNWNLGVMLNRNNDITVGYKNKRKLQSAIFNFVKDLLNGNPWDKTDIMSLNGQISYYKMIEGCTIDRILAHMSGKMGVDIPRLIKQAIKC